MTEADRLLAYSAAVKARATAEANGRDAVMMLCELLVLMAPNEIKTWVDRGSEASPSRH